MKLLLISFLCIFVLSCSKENTPTPISVTGNWKMVETYDNYKNGIFQWNSVPDSVKVVMEFNAHQSYRLSHNNLYIYTGKYTVDNASKKVTITRPDGIADYIFTISEYSNTRLTVDYISGGSLFRQKLIKQ